MNALKFCLKHANCMPVYREIISPKLSKLTDFGGSLRLHQVQSVCAKFHTDRCIIPHVLTSCKTYCCIVFLCLKACLIDRICLRLLFSHGAVCWSWCRYTQFGNAAAIQSSISWSRDTQQWRHTVCPQVHAVTHCRGFSINQQVRHYTTPFRQLC